MSINILIYYFLKFNCLLIDSSCISFYFISNGSCGSTNGVPDGSTAVSTTGPVVSTHTDAQSCINTKIGAVSLIIS